MYQITQKCKRNNVSSDLIHAIDGSSSAERQSVQVILMTLFPCIRNLLVKWINNYDI